MLLWLLLPLDLLGLVGCSRDSEGEEEPPLVEQEPPISFASELSETPASTEALAPSRRLGAPATRAIGLETMAQSFRVWGFKNLSVDVHNNADPADDTYGELQTVFPGYTVNWQANTAATTATNSHNWEYVGINSQTIKFWDWSAKAYRFFAIAPYNASVPTTGDTYTVTLPADATVEVSELATVEEKIAATPYFSRLWFSTGDPVAYADKQFGKSVQLEFVKPLSRVRFIFKYVFPREGIKLTGVSFKPSEGSANTTIALKGTVTVSYPLTGTATKETYTSTRNASPVGDEELTAFTEDYDPEDDTKKYTQTDNGWYTVFPSMDQDSYTLSVNINSAAKTAVVPAEFMRWLPGYSYTYIFKITDEGGVEIGGVEYAVTPWTELEATHLVYNW